MKSTKHLLRKRMRNSLCNIYNESDINTMSKVLDIKLDYCFNINLDNIFMLLYSNALQKFIVFTSKAESNVFNMNNAGQNKMDNFLTELHIYNKDTGVLEKKRYIKECGYTLINAKETKDGKLLLSFYKSFIIYDLKFLQIVTIFQFPNLFNYCNIISSIKFIDGNIGLILSTSLLNENKEDINQLEQTNSIVYFIEEDYIINNKNLYFHSKIEMIQLDNKNILILECFRNIEHIDCFKVSIYDSNTYDFIISDTFHQSNSIKDFKLYYNKGKYAYILYESINNGLFMDFYYLMSHYPVTILKLNTSELNIENSITLTNESIFPYDILYINYNEFILSSNNSFIIIDNNFDKHNYIIEKNYDTLDFGNINEFTFFTYGIKRDEAVHTVSIWKIKY